MADTPVVVTQGVQPPRRCSGCGRFAPAGTRSDDEHLFFGADPDDYDKTRCASCARTELHKRNVPHYQDGCRMCAGEVDDDDD